MSDLLTRAKEIKNATEIGENTAERVGGVMVDTVKALPTTIRVSRYDYSMMHEDENGLYTATELILQNSEGEEVTRDRIYGASDNYPGLMSIRKFRQVNAHEEAIAALQERAVFHEDSLTTHGKQITALQNKGQNMEYDIEQQQGVLNSQGTRLTEVEHRADEHDTQIAQINTDMKQMDDNILRHGEEIEDLQDEMDTKQQELTLTMLDNGNIRIGNPMHYTYEEYGCVWNGGEDKIVETPWEAYTDDEEYKVVTHKSRRWLLNGIGDLTTDEVRRICARGSWNSNDNFPLGYSLYLNRNRTFLPRSGEQNGAFNQSISGYNTTVEIINLFNALAGNSSASIALNQPQNYFISNTKLRYIYGGFLVLNAASPGAFQGCSSLRICKIKTKVNLFVGDSPEFNNYSIRYAIENVQTESNIVITLHEDAYVRAMSDASILEALATHTNVTLASA